MGLGSLSESGFGALGRLGEASLSAEDALASRYLSLYNPPVKPPRPFEADYPQGAPGSAAGQLTADIEGRALGARWVVGRRVVGGPDQAFPAAELNALTKAGTGRNAAVLAQSEIGSDQGVPVLGRTTYDLGTGVPQAVYLSRDLTRESALLVHAHENGHVINQLAELPRGLEAPEHLQGELRRVYNDLNNPDPSHRGIVAFAGPTKPLPENIVSPETRGYVPADVDHELWTEAIRAYMADPNYLKTVAPKVAAAIRAAVNANPRLAGTIQFNSSPPSVALGGVAAGAQAQQP